MKFLTLAAAALALTISASASTVVITCTSNSAADGQNFFTVGNVPGMTNATSVCPTFSALPVGEVFQSVSLVLQADYTGGAGSTTNATTTTFTNGGNGIPDVILATSAGSATGFGPAFAYTDETTCSSGTPTCPPNAPTFGTNYFIIPDVAFNAGNYTTLVTTEDFTTAVTSGSVQGASEQAFLVLNFTSAAPEPASMLLMGGGLLAIGLVRRKLVRK
jgi:hypothetical protein